MNNNDQHLVFEAYLKKVVLKENVLPGDQSQWNTTTDQHNKNFAVDYIYNQWYESGQWSSWGMDSDNLNQEELAAAAAEAIQNAAKRYRLDVKDLLQPVADLIDDGLYITIPVQSIQAHLK